MLSQSDPTVIGLPGLPWQTIPPGRGHRNQQYQKHKAKNMNNGKNQWNFIGGGVGMVSEWGMCDYNIITGGQGKNEIKTRRNEVYIQKVYSEETYVTRYSNSIGRG